jgi:hypothetical protein
MNSVAVQKAIKGDKYRVSMAATFAVASELSRRGYNVGLTVGNTPKVDLICSVPEGKAFKVQVKGLSGKTSVWIQRRFLTAPKQKNLFLIVVLVPPPPEPYVGPRFFILTHAQAIQRWSAYTKKDGTPYSSTSGDGLYWKDIEPYEGKWEVLPNQS